jgi:hypothetical protein
MGSCFLSLVQQAVCFQSVKGVFDVLRGEMGLYYLQDDISSYFHYISFGKEKTTICENGCFSFLY